MNKDLQLIALTLTNIVGTDSEVNLLSSQTGADNSPFDSYYQIDFLNTFLLAVRCTLSYTLNGTPINYNANGGLVVPDVDALILDLNTNLGTYALFSYEISPTPNTYTLIIKILNSNFIPVTLEIYN